MSTDLTLLAVTAISACLGRHTVSERSTGGALGTGLSVFLTRLVSMFIDLSVLTAEVVRGQSTNKIIFILFSVQEDYAGYDFENRLHVRIHSAFASMTASAQP